MNRVAAVLALFLALTLSLPAIAQDNQGSSEDASAVRATVTNYIEAYYTGDASRMQQTLHPHYLKHMIHGDLPMREWTVAKLVDAVRENGPADLPAADKTEKVIVLDISGAIASAKLITPGWTDYLILEKFAGEWKILSVVQRIDN